MFDLLHAIRELKATEISTIIFKKTKQRVAPQTIRNWRNNKTRYASTRTERLALKAVDISLMQIPNESLDAVRFLLQSHANAKTARNKNIYLNKRGKEIPLQVH